jgi:hypothetical protein
MAILRELGSRRKIRAGDLGRVARERDERVVEIVAAQVVHARRPEDLVPVASHADERRVERAAAEVVDDDVITLRRERAPVPVRVLEPRRRRLVQHGHRREARAPERLEGDEALRPVRIRGDGDDAADGLPRRQGFRLGLALRLDRGALFLPQVRLRLQRDAKPNEEALDELPEPEGARAHLHDLAGDGARIGEQSLERTHHRPGVAQRERFEAEEQLPSPLRHDRREPVVRVSALVEEAHDGVVATVGVRHHRARGPEIDAQLHARPPRARGPRRHARAW